MFKWEANGRGQRLVVGNPPGLSRGRLGWLHSLKHTGASPVDSTTNDHPSTTNIRGRRMAGEDLQAVAAHVHRGGGGGAGGVDLIGADITEIWVIA